MNFKSLDTWDKPDAELDAMQPQTTSQPAGRCPAGHPAICDTACKSLCCRYEHFELLNHRFLESKARLEAFQARGSYVILAKFPEIAEGN